jgi:hypothetical protein
MFIAGCLDADFEQHETGKQPDGRFQRAQMTVYRAGRLPFAGRLRFELTSDVD